MIRPHCGLALAVSDLLWTGASQVVLKNLPANIGDVSDAQVGKIPWRRAWQPTLVFLPGESHGQKSQQV